MKKLAKERLKEKGFSEDQIEKIQLSIDNNLHLREVLCTLPFVEDTLNALKKTDILLTSLGHANSDRIDALAEFGLLERSEEREKFKRQLPSRAVGEICAQLFDADGADVPTPWRAIGMQLNSIRERVSEGNLRVVMVVGADSKRCMPLLAALRGGLVTDLVTDAATASRIIRLQKARGVS